MARIDQNMLIMAIFWSILVQTYKDYARICLTLAVLALSG